MKKKAICVILVLILLIGCVPMTMVADTYPIPGKTYLIQTPSSGKYVSTNGLVADGSDLIGKAFSGSYSTGYRASELWMPIYTYYGDMFALFSQDAHKSIYTTGKLTDGLWARWIEGSSGNNVYFSGTGASYGTKLMYRASTNLLYSANTQNPSYWTLVDAHHLGYTTTNYSTSYQQPGTFTQFVNYVGQCTWYAFGRAQEKLGVTITFSEPSGNHAKTWYDRIDNEGVQKDDTPRANSIAVFAPKPGKTGYGHVVFIEYIHGNNIYYSEANYGSSGNGSFDFNQDGVLKCQTIAEFENRSTVNDLVGYVYLESIIS